MAVSWVGKKGVTEVFNHGQKIPSGLNLFKAQLITSQSQSVLHFVLISMIFSS